MNEFEDQKREDILGISKFNIYFQVLFATNVCNKRFWLVSTTWEFCFNFYIQVKFSIKFESTIMWFAQNLSQPSTTVPELSLFDCMIYLSCF